ncbi:MAG: acylglycerol kinase family protein, partial [Chloroflexi bacterium]|nr:acylglycerol kinase family protein [Chloroflexota bacterium]
MLKNHINMGNNAGWLVVVNPNAGGRRGQKKWPAIEKKLLDEGFQYQACFTKGPLHATKLTLQGLEEGFRKIIAVGGDGTLNEVANGILAQKEIPATDISLGMIPVGSG